MVLILLKFGKQFKMIAMNTNVLKYQADKVWVLLVIFIMGLSSCKKDVINGEDGLGQPTKVTRTADLKVSDAFKWNTINEMQVEITPNKSGLLIIQGAKAEIFHKAFLQAGNTHKARLTLPNTNENLFVYFNGAKEEIKVVAGAIVRSNLK
jgi:hypothetical protein